MTRPPTFGDTLFFGNLNWETQSLNREIQL